MHKNAATIKPLWQTTYDWLRLQNFAVNKSFVKAEISTHPDYPALTSIIDFCNIGGLNSFNAVQADASHIHEMNYPVLAHIKQPGNEYMHIIPTAADWDLQKEITKDWSGVTIFPEKNAAWQHPENEAAIKETRQQQFFSFALGVVAILLFTWLSYTIATPAIILFGFLSLAGLVISLFALGTELGYQNDLVKQVCGAVSNGGCEKVLKSKNAKGFAGFTPADFSVLYFATQFIVLGFTAFNPSLFYVAATAGMLGIVAIGWSLYTQAAVLKQWCALCLGIVGVLILQFVTAIYSLFAADNIINFFSQIALSSLAVFVLTAIALAIFYRPLKQMLAANNKLKQQAQELKSWKLDASLFVAKWKEQPLVDTTTWENDLLLGNPDAPLQIIVACNPYCGPCARAHKQLDEILEHHPGIVNVKVRLLFRLDDKENKLNIAANNILTIAENVTSEQKQQLLSDWFKWMNLEKWEAKWKIAELNMDHKMRQHADWIENSNINYTPTFFINGKQIPGKYNLQILDKLVPSLAAEKNMFANIPQDEVVHG